MKQQLLLIPVALCCSMLYAEESSALEKKNPEKSPWELSATTSAAYYPKADHESGSSHFSGISGAYDGAKAVVEFDAAYTLPFLRGDNAFTKGHTDEGEWVSDVNKLSEYFVDGSLLCTRWEDNDGKEYREWWEIESIKDGVMNWTALRIGDDGKPFTATFSMTKVK